MSLTAVASHQSRLQHRLQKQRTWVLGSPPGTWQEKAVEPQGSQVVFLCEDQPGTTPSITCLSHPPAGGANPGHCCRCQVCMENATSQSQAATTETELGGDGDTSWYPLPGVTPTCESPWPQYLSSHAAAPAAGA